MNLQKKKKKNKSYSMLVIDLTLKSLPKKKDLTLKHLYLSIARQVDE